MKKKALKAQTDLLNNTKSVYITKGHVSISINNDKLNNGKGISFDNLSVIPSEFILKARSTLRQMEARVLDKEGFGKLLKMINETSNININDKEGSLNRMGDILLNEEQKKSLVQSTLVSIYKAENSAKALNEIAKSSNSILYSAVNNEYWNNMCTQFNSRHFPKYPIEDSELYSNPILHSLDSLYLTKPIGVEIPFIPRKKLNQLMLIWDFCQTFAHKNRLYPFSIIDLYFALKYSSTNTVPLLVAIHSSFLFILVTEIVDKDYQTLQSEGELMLLKRIFDNLNCDDKKLQFIHSTWIEIIKLLIESTQFMSYKNDSVNEVYSTIKSMSPSTYNTFLTFDQKVGILMFLLSSSYETKYIREVIKVEQEKRNELRKIKRDHEEELKFTEARKRELERQEKYTMPKEKIESLTKHLQTLSEDNQTLTRQQLARMRKEKENEREKYKSVIKESEMITQRCDDMAERIEKIQTEISEIPSMNKKCIGIDGLGNKYFFFPWERDRLYIRKKREWRVLITNESIQKLIFQLSDKGIHEKSLLVKLNRIYPKMLRCANDTLSPDYNEEYYINTMLQWHDNGIMSKEMAKYEEEQYDHIANELNTLEAKITDYLSSDNKEWESFDVRFNIKSWLECNRDITEFAKILLLWNERCKNPYKIKQTLGKNIIEDEYDLQFNLIDDKGKLDITKLNPSVELALKTRLWSKDNEAIALEDIYLEYVSSINSFGALFLSIYCFKAVFDDLIRRRDFYRKKLDADDMVIDFPENSVKEPTAMIHKSKVIIIRDDDEIEEEIEEEIPMNRRSNGRDIKYEENNSDDEMNNNNQSDYSNEDTNEKYKSKLRNGSKIRIDLSANNTNHYDSTFSTKYNNKAKVKIIDWNETCLHCNEFGDLICCEDCPNVTHLSCANLTREPEKWRCDQCIYRLANKRMTRSQLNN